MQQITASNWQLLSPLLDDALLLTPAARVAWLGEQTHLTAANHAHLARLVALANAPETDHLFQELTGAISAPTPHFAAMQYGHADEHVGPYQLLRLLGRGGMAEVWLARRSDGAYERDVALKLPLAHLPQNVAAERLLRERNVLAALEHPAIARLYDAGVAANGQPYLAMEYVEGESILNHANRLRLDLKARAQLLLAVLDALHYAHQHLIVHRDLKPSNIMVRPDGRVTLLDFGIAKVLESATAATQATELTQAAGTALTLAYAAPEQLLAEPVTTTTDLYSAGVVMFELLVGTRPFAHAERSPSSLLQAIDSAPVPLRVNLTNEIGALAHGYDSASAWGRAYQGDLAAICARALRREPEARYASALSMRDDLARYLADRPVQARAGAWSYRWRKFFDRNRTAVLVSTAAAVAAAGFGAHAWQQRQDSRISAARATAIESVVNNLFDGMNPNSNATRSFTAKELLDKSRPLMLQAATADADSRSKTNMMMGKLYLDIGELIEATALFETEINEARAVGDVRREVWAQCLLADAEMDQGKFQSAFERTNNARKRLLPLAKQPNALLAEIEYRLGTASYFLRNYADAKTHLNSANAALRALDSNDPTRVETLANVLIKQGTLARAEGDLQAASRYFSDAQLRLQNTSGMQLTKHVLDIETLPVAVSLGRFDEVISKAHMLLAQLATQAPENSTYPLSTRVHLINALIRTGRLSEATDQAQQISAFASTSKDVGAAKTARDFAATIALYSGQSKTALREFTELLAQELNPADGIVQQSSLQAAQRQIAHSLLNLGRTEEALSQLRSLEAQQVAQLPDPQHASLAFTRILLGVAQLRGNEVVNATENFTRARNALVAKRGPNYWGAMLADAYLVLATAPQNLQLAPTANALLLAERVQRELGWQSGANELATRLKNRASTLFSTVPAVL